MRALSGAGAALLLAVAGCGGDSGPEKVDVTGPATITVTSTAFDDGSSIPATYSCDGDGQSPPLAWTGVPAGAAAIALVVDDPDAPNGAFTHWVVLDIPATVASSPEGGVPTGGVEAENSAGNASWTGPCPPSGTHHYRFTVYALSNPTGLSAGTSLDDALRAVEKNAIASGSLTGTFHR